MDYTEMRFNAEIADAEKDPSKDDVYISHLKQLLREYLEKRDKRDEKR